MKTESEEEKVTLIVSNNRVVGEKKKKKKLHSKDWAIIWTCSSLWTEMKNLACSLKRIAQALFLLSGLSLDLGLIL